MTILTNNANRRNSGGGVETSISGDAHHLERCGYFAYVRGPSAHVQGASLKALGHVHWRGFSPGHQRDLKRLQSARNRYQWSTDMNTVHAAREAAPVFKPSRPLHPVDRICEARHHIKGLTIVLSYAVEKNGTDQDGPAHQYVAACFDAILFMADEIDEALDELCLDYEVTKGSCNARAAA